MFHTLQRLSCGHWTSPDDISYQALFAVQVPYSNSAVGIGHRPVYVRVADAPTAEPGIRRKYSSTVARHRCNVKHTRTNSSGHWYGTAVPNME